MVGLARRTDDLDLPIAALIREERWSDACRHFERELDREVKLQAEQRLPYAIALIRSGRVSSGMAVLADLPFSTEARLALRRHVIPTLIRDKRLDLALTLTGWIVDHSPEPVEDLRLRASLLGRLRRGDEAMADLVRLIEFDPTDAVAQTSLLQLFLQSDRVEEAGAHAATLGAMVLRNERLCLMALLALSRSGRQEAALALAGQAENLWDNDPEVAAAIARIYVDAGRSAAAIDLGERSLAIEPDNGRLRQSTGEAYLADQRPDRLAKALAHFREAARLLPRDSGAQAQYGEALLRSGQAAAAIEPLALACRLRTDLPNARALLARAYKQDGRHADAAREFKRLLDLQPQSQRWHRFAAGALSQAGHRKEAAALFETFTEARRQRLPDSFEDGLRALQDGVDDMEIPQARLDWAWTLRRDQGLDRAEWERRARWGNLADHYILDWLECRDAQVHEAMGRLADLTEAEQVLATVDLSRGAILASAHIGPMYAGPLALELLGVRSQWLASTPSVARTSYARSLISTSDQTGAEVARQVLQGLREGNAIVIAVDGALSLSAPRTTFEGQEITYSDFAARMAHRQKVPSLFVAPYWKEGSIHFLLERMPDPGEGEAADDHAERWRTAYLSSLRNYLGAAPENLRLSGGIWRHIRSADRSSQR